MSPEEMINKSRCCCGVYPIDTEHAIAVFNSNDVAVERHAVGACNIMVEP